MIEKGLAEFILFSSLMHIIEIIVIVILANTKQDKES
jgi:hypothetical protein